MKNINKKSLFTNIFRLVVQIIFFIFLPSIYVQALNGIKQIYLAIISHNFGIDLLSQLVAVIVTIPVTIILGRFFCGWMCGFGAFTDFIYAISSKIIKKRIIVSEKLDALMKNIKYAILILLVSAVWTLDVTIFKTANPWDAFGMLATVGKTPDFSYVLSNLLPALLIFIFIIVMSVFIERFFCRYLCPMGAIFAIASKLRIGKIKKPKDKCGSCRICTNNCAMGIPLYKTDVVNSGECINCMKCVSVCPRNNTAYTVAKKDVRPLIASTASIAFMAGSYFTVYAATGSSGNDITSDSGTSQSEYANQLYNDGTYQGTGSGFRRAATTVSVTIKNDKITNISTVSYGDDRPYYDRSFTAISQDIISSQSADVDAVSGATFSSNGIMEAVANAISKAKISDVSVSVAQETATAETVQETTASTVSSEKASATSDVTNNIAVTTVTAETTSAPAVITTTAATSETAAVSYGKYKDGTYQGSGTGYKRATTTVSVVVSGGNITNINVVSYGDDRPYFSRAFSAVSEDIISSQSTDVDTVSGATFSSNGIMSAVADAISKAK